MTLINDPGLGKILDDVPCYIREGVGGLHKIVGLAEAVARLSGRSFRDLSTRAGIEHASAYICVRHPMPPAPELRLRIATVLPPEAFQVFELARRVMDENPEAGWFRSGLASGKDSRVASFLREVSTTPSMPSQARAAWTIITVIARALGIHARNIRDGRDLSRLAGRAVRQLSGMEKKMAMGIAALPRAYACDPDAAAVEYAHAARERGTIAVIVERATETMVWRHSGLTGVRPVAPRPWHRDPDVAAVMAESAAASLARGASRHVFASANQAWTQAVLADHAAGYEVYIQRTDGRVDHVDVTGWGTPSAFGTRQAAQIAYFFGERVRDQRSLMPLREPKTLPDADEKGPVTPGRRYPELISHLATGKVNLSALTRFEYRVEGSMRRANDAAILTFLASLPEEVARLARLIAPLRAWDAASNRRFPPGRQQLDAAVAASTHPDPGAMIRAIEGSSTRILILVAALRGPWRAASEAIASGIRPQTALHAYAEAVAGRKLPPAALKSVIEWPRSSHHGLGSSASFTDFADLAKLAAVLWAGTPSRPPMSIVQLEALRTGLSQFGFQPPSVAGPGDRTWDDPFLTTAYADALRRERADVPGSAALGPGVIDAIHFFDARLGSLGCSPKAREAVRCAILASRRRMIPKLEQISGAWHRVVDRMVRDRQTLLDRLTIEEGSEGGLFDGLRPADEYPNPLSGVVRISGVDIQPLRNLWTIELEAKEMANCLMSYCEDARIGALLLFRLESRFGRSTLGLRVYGDAPHLEIGIFQHGGAQHFRVDAPPPSGHARAVSHFMTALNEDDGGPGGPDWREKLSEARRAHALRASLRPAGQGLSRERQQQLAAFDLSQLDLFLTREQRMLSLDAFCVWAESLLETPSSQGGS